MTQPPQLDVNRLTPVASNSPVCPGFLGYTPDSWLSLIESEGPVYQTAFRGEPAYAIGGHEADIAVWKSPDNWLYGPPSSGGNFFRQELGEMHVTQLDGEPHRRSRKLILPAFGVAAVTRDFDVVADTLARGMRGWTGSTLDLHPAFSRLITQALNVSQLKESISPEEINKLVTFEEGFIPASALEPEVRQKWYDSAEYSDARKAAFAYFESVVDERLAGTRKHDSLDLVMERAVPEGLSPLSRDELVRAVYLLCVAGVGNIANILCAALWALGKHPDWISIIRDELGDFGPVSMKQGSRKQRSMKQGMGSLPNLKALISEVERCYLPAPVIPKMSAGPVNFMGYDIPGKAHILHLHGLAHFENERYAAPLEFDPARWLDKETPRGNAFGGGPHLCLGMGVTRFYVPLMLAGFISSFDWAFEKPPAFVSQAPGLDCAPLTTSFFSRLSGRV